MYVLKSYNKVGNLNREINNTIGTFMPFEKLCTISPENHPSTFCQNETKKSDDYASNDEKDDNEIYHFELSN